MTTQRGTVGEFDEHVGLGAVAGDDGGSYRFHCTQIADGSRTIPVGVRVEYSLAAAHGGRWEAVEVRPLT
ncbi:cold shock domain-containing protein [Acidiferrimicrobium sp. IK]|uniref:cold shock domain-containing protein n=1 Tax=Acidiferrimicrobium sp. IK TaxID=2871700 RepID=UPI0021CB5ED8|nr:cold shock domain-containing protein [Acidiferrimicrobium sp. IK]MCU4184784.1 cold shock domain-containing protein [Acidiferrimicrobium sp. IK]